MTNDHTDNDCVFDKDCAADEEIENQNMGAFTTNI